MTSWRLCGCCVCPCGPRRFSAQVTSGLISSFVCSKLHTSQPEWMPWRSELSHWLLLESLSNIQCIFAYYYIGLALKLFHFHRNLQDLLKTVKEAEVMSLTRTLFRSGWQASEFCLLLLKVICFVLLFDWYAFIVVSSSDQHNEI